MCGSCSKNLGGPAEGAADDAADDERGPEVARAASAANRQARGHYLDAAEQCQKLDAAPPEREQVGAADGHLRRAVPAAEDTQSLSRLPQARADDDDDGHREDAERQAAQARLEPLGRGQIPGRTLYPAHRRQERARRERNQDGKERIQRQVLRFERVARRVREQRVPAEEGDRHRVCDDAREDARHESVRLEVVPVEHLDGHERGAQGRSEDGRHAGRGAGDEQDPPLAVGHSQQLADERIRGRPPSALSGPRVRPSRPNRWSAPRPAPSRRRPACVRSLSSGETPR